MYNKESASNEFRVGDIIRTSDNALLVGYGKITAYATDDYEDAEELGFFIVNFGKAGTCTVHKNDMEWLDPAPETNPDFWDCECDNNYIQPKTIEKCPKCGAYQNDMPDSRQHEIDNEIDFLASHVKNLKKEWFIMTKQKIKGILTMLKTLMMNSQPCKHCEETDLVVGFDLGDENLDVRFDTENAQIDIIYLAHDIDHSIQIKFCPFCGRELG